MSVLVIWLIFLSLGYVRVIDGSKSDELIWEVMGRLIVHMPNVLFEGFLRYESTISILLWIIIRSVCFVFQTDVVEIVVSVLIIIGAVISETLLIF
jgi:hypothetical protein